MNLNLNIQTRNSRFDNPLKNRQYRMRQGSDLIKIKINTDDESGDGSYDTVRFSSCDQKGTATLNAASSLFQKNKTNSQSLREQFYQQVNQQDDNVNLISNRSPEMTPKALSDIAEFQLQDDNTQKSRLFIRGPSLLSRQPSKSVHTEPAVYSGQNLLSEELRLPSIGSSKDVNESITTPRQNLLKKQSSRKLPQIKQPAISTQRLSNRGSQRNNSSNAKLETISNSSIQVQQQTPLTIKKKPSILTILSPTSESQRDVFTQNTSFSSQKKDQKKNKPLNVLTSPINKPSDITKLKVNFYEKINSLQYNEMLPGTYMTSRKRSTYGSDLSNVLKKSQGQNINPHFQDMVEEKNLFSSLISPQSPDLQIYKNVSNKSAFTYNSPLFKNNRSNLFLTQQNPIQNNSNELAFSQALSSRIGAMKVNEDDYTQSSNFHSTYKNIQKMQQQSDHYNQEMELQQTILSKAYQNNVLPRKLGLVKSSENDYQSTSHAQTTKDGKKYLNLTHLNIGSTYHNIVSAALVHIDFANLYSLNLSYNNLTSVSVEVILQNLPDSISRVDLSNNHIGTSGASSLRSAFNSKKYVHLRYLNLSSNQLGDNGLKQIYESIQQNTSMYSIDLSYNKLSDQACIYLQSILINNSYIQELYLQWNKFSSRGGLVLANGLAQNYNIRVINLSHNGLGSLSKLQSGMRIIQSCTIVESGMRHLDLSYNQYVKSEAIQISEVLQQNQKLYGFHFQDARGFMYFQIDKDVFNKNILEFITNQRSINNVSSTGHNKAQSFDCKTVDNCWLCDGWQEIKFEIKIGCSDSFTGEPVFLHLDFEEYKPMYMDRDLDDPQQFVLYRMCPPGRQISFFFSDPCNNIVYSSKDYEKVDFFIPEGINQDFFKDDDEFDVSDGSIKKKFTVKYLDGSVITLSTPAQINIITTKQESSIILNQSDYESCVKSIPRSIETYYKINFSNQWHRGISFFRNYIQDSEELENKCFEEDWNNSKISSVIQTVRGSNLEDCKKLLFAIYRQLRMCYKHLSVAGMSGDIFCVSQNPYTIFVQSTDILDNNLIKIRDVDLNFLTSSSKVLKTKSYRAPDKTLIRNEFMEVIVRLAVDKYIKSKIHTTVEQALEVILTTEAFLDFIISFEYSQEWRNERYWNQKCDDVIRNYIEFIKILWSIYADSRKGEKRYYSSTKTMALYEFKDFIMQFELIDDYYTDKDIPYTYNLSMMTQVDELSSDRYIQMNFDEFLETLARIAEKKSMTPIGEIESEYSEQERKQVSLQYKLESFLQSLSIKYEKLFQKDKKKQSSNFQYQTAYKNQDQSNKTSTYICWLDVMSERKQQLKQNILSIIKKEEIIEEVDIKDTPNLEQTQEIAPEIVRQNTSTITPQ